MTTMTTIAATSEERPGVARHFRLQWEEAQGAWVLLYPEGMVKLSQSAGEILRRCDGVRSVGTIVDELEQAFNAHDLAGEVHAFLTMARKHRWIEG